MLTLVFSMLMTFPTPNFVTVYHGARTEYVFTQGATIHVRQPKPACETYAPRTDGMRVTVCGGRVVSMTDASGYTLSYPESR